MKTRPDYYATLGVEKTADLDTIKKAYRKLAMEHHPDVAQDKKAGEAKFKDINEAYATLSDEAKRTQYDANPSGYAEPGMGFGSAAWSPDAADFMTGGFNPWNMHGQSRRHRPNMRDLRQRARCNNIEADVHHILQCTLRDILLGFNKDVTIERVIACSHCKGAGGNETNGPCHKCRGTGSQTSFIGPGMMYQAQCEDCFGTGHHIEICTHCQGNFTVQKKTITVQVPAGMRSQDTLKVAGMGHSVYNNPHNSNQVNGDLYLKVHYANVQNGVAVKNGDLYTSVFVPIDLIVADAHVEVDILGVKKVQLKLKHDKKVGHVYTIHGAGLDAQHEAKIKVFPEIPKKKLDAATQQRLLAELKAIYGESEKTIYPATGSADTSESE